jgi:hypothetical protein
MYPQYNSNIILKKRKKNNQELKKVKIKKNTAPKFGVPQLSSV